MVQYHVKALQLTNQKMEEKKIFQSKKELLEYLGKSPNDRKLIDRMVARGEVKIGGWVYELIQKVEVDELTELKSKNEELEKKVKRQQDEIDMLKEVLSNEQQTDAEEAKIQREYREAKANRYQKAMNLVIRTTYNVIKPKLGNRLEDYDEFRDSILNSVKEQLGDDE